MIFGLAKILRPKEFLRAKYLRSQLSGAVEQFNLMLSFLKTITSALESASGDSLTTEELNRLFADYGVV